MTIQDKIVKIRKEHQCFSCLRKFEKGSYMRYWFGIYEGDVCSSYCCGSCQQIINHSDEHGLITEGYFHELFDRNGMTPEEYLIFKNISW